MASFRKRGDKWAAEVRAKGVSRSKTFRTKMEAQRWALNLEQQIGKHPGVVVSHSLREAMQRYAREVSHKKKGARWEMIRLKKLERDPLADIMLMDLRREDLQKWIDRQKLAPNSIRRELSVIAAVLRESRVHWQWMVDNPLPDLKKPKKAPPRDRLIADKELDRLLLALEYEEGAPIATMRQEIAVAGLLALETAMRQGELWGLDWSRVFFRSPLCAFA
jgi:integrase